MDPQMALDIAIPVGMVRNTRVIAEGYLSLLMFRNASVEVQSLSKSGFSKWITTFPLRAFQR